MWWMLVVLPENRLKMNLIYLALQFWNKKIVFTYKVKQQNWKIVEKPKPNPGNVGFCSPMINKLLKVFSFSWFNFNVFKKVLLDHYTEISNQNYLEHRTKLQIISNNESTYKKNRQTINGSHRVEPMGCVWISDVKIER